MYHTIYGNIIVKRPANGKWGDATFEKDVITNNFKGFDNCVFNCTSGTLGVGQSVSFDECKKPIVNGTPLDDFFLFDNCDEPKVDGKGGYDTVYKTDTSYSGVFYKNQTDLTTTNVEKVEIAKGLFNF